MAKFKVTDPEGRAVIVEAENPEQAVSISRSSRTQPRVDNIQAPPVEVSAPSTKGPGFNWGALMDTVKDTPRYLNMAGNSIAQGAMDAVVGAGQLASKAMPQSVEDRFSDYMRQRETDYREDRTGYENLVDFGRITGNIIPGLIMGGTSVPSTLTARMAQNAKIGGTLGSTAPVDPDAVSFVDQKALQVGLGAAGGALAVPAVEGATRAVAGAVNALGRAYKGAANSVGGQTSTQTIETTLKAEFTRNGVDWMKMTQEARAGIVSEVQKALKAGGKIDTQAVTRLAQFEKVGIKPTTGQVTRDPNQYALERNLGKMEIGAPLAQRFEEQNSRLISVLDDTRANTGASGADSYETGKNVIGGLLGKDATRKAGVDRAYTAARDELGRAAPVSASEFTTKANLALDEEMLGHYLPSEVRSLMNDVAGGKIPLNVDTMVRIDQVLSGAQRSAGNGTPQSLAISKVRDALNAAPIESEAGEAAKASFDAARGMAKQRFFKIEATPALAAALGKDVPPERFVENFLIRGDIDQVATLMREIPVGARREARAAVIDWIKHRSVSASGGDTAQLTQSGLNKSLAAIGQRKLNLIFAGDKQGQAMLKALADVSSYIQKAPISSGVNNSGSATTILDAMDKAARLPILGPFVGKPSDILKLSQVAKATGPAAPVLDMEPIISEGLLGRLAPRAGLLAAPVAGAFPFALSR